MKPYISTTIELDQINRRMEFIQLVERMNKPGITYEKDVIFMNFECDNAEDSVNYLAFNLLDFLVDGHDPILINVKYYNILLDCDIIILDKIIYMKQATKIA